MTNAFIISQLLIVIAFLFDIASFQFKQRNITLFCFFCATCLISLHFILLDEITAACIAGLAAVRFLISIYSTDKLIMIIFIILICSVGVYTFDGIEDTFSILAGSLATYSAFQSNDRILRMIMMIATLSMITHNAIIWTPAGIMLEIFFLLSNITSYCRFYIKCPN